MIFRRRNRQRPDSPSPNELIPPEGVTLTLPIAGVGVRIAAQITDFFLTGLAAACIVIVLTILDLASPQSLTAIVVLLFFLIRVPYYIITELIWNGQTLGKRMMKIKVVSHDGRSLTSHALVLRNMMKEAEVFLPATLLLTMDAASPVDAVLSLIWVILCLLIPCIDRYRRRLGDMMAGTHVIHRPEPVLLADLAGEKQRVSINRTKFVFLSHQLDHYGAFELQTLESLLRNQATRPAEGRSPQRDATVAAIVEKIRNKIGFADPVPPEDRLIFLQAFYNSQREHLEKRRLFGDRRENKHYAQNDEDA